jgi:hypothetical protein
MLLADTSEKLDPMSLLLYMSGLSVVLLLPAAIILEPSSFGQAADMVLNKPGFAWWLVCNCSLAYAVNLTNFLVTKYTSALTLQVSGWWVGGWVGGSALHWLCDHRGARGVCFAVCLRAAHAQEVFLMWTPRLSTCYTSALIHDTPAGMDAHHGNVRSRPQHVPSIESTT